MSRLSQLVPAGEAILWVSPPAFRLGPIASALLSLVPIPKTRVAMTGRHIAWRRASWLTAMIGRGRSGLVALDRIRSVLAYAGDGTLVLHDEGGEAGRIEGLPIGLAEELAVALRKPARIWRPCRSPGAALARRWRRGLEAFGELLFIVPFIGLLLAAGAEGSGAWIGYLLFGLIAGAILCDLIQAAAPLTLAHLLAGRRLPPEERCDFVCTLADPLWEGKERDPAGPAYRRFHSLETWALRKAYGEIPDCGAIEPEVVAAGDPRPAKEDEG